MKPANNEHYFIEIINKGYLKIDCAGRIWRISKKYKDKNVAIANAKEIKTIGSGGYISIQLRKKGKKYSCRAHRIVWIYFNGEIPDGLEMNHKNGIKTDNRLENLELLTPLENTRHAIKIGLLNNRGENSYNSKLTEGNIRVIRLRYKNGELQKDIAQDFNISRKQISCIVNMKQWSHI